jgi:hypothetical protein
MKTPTFSVELGIDFDRRSKSSTPVRVEIDFDSLLREAGGAGLVDPHTILLRRQPREGVKIYPVQFDERLYYANRGWVAWLVDEPTADDKWRLEFDLRAENGHLVPAPRLPLVGVGEELYYNRPGPQPIGAPGRHAMPLAVDWNGDGLIDVIAASHHSNTIGMDWAGVFFWRNIGTNAEPRFAPPFRLYADGVDQVQRNGRMEDIRPQKEFVSEDYICCDVFDWFGTGRIDLITASRRGGIKVYRNSGRLDQVGLPRLELATKIAFPAEMTVGRYLQVKVRNWDGSGRPSLILASRHRNKKEYSEREQIILMLNRGRDSDSGDWKFTPIVLPISGSRIFGPDNSIADWRESNFTNHRATSIDVFDIDRDGKLELLCCHVKDRGGPIIEVWRNVGTDEEPSMMNQGGLPWSRDCTTFAFHFVRNAAFQGCIRANWYSDYGFRYFEQVGCDPFDPRSFHDTGPLLGEGCKIKHAGMVKGDPIDLRGDGAFDLICGDAGGFVTRVRNVGDRSAPAFSPPEKVVDAEGRPVRLNRESIMVDNNTEAETGQLKPFVCDWDSDGKLDILVGNNTNRIIWLRDYDPEQNQIREKVELKVRGLHDPFGYRKGPAAVDFDNDGRLELLAVDSLGIVSLSKQGEGGDGPRFLEPPIPLEYVDGKVILNSDIGKALAETEGVRFLEDLPAVWQEPAITLCACDWTGNGTLDLMISSCWYTFLLENAGDNQSPKFGYPKPIRDPEGRAIKLSQHESHVTAYDWDGDSRPDLIIGGESGGLYLFHHDWLSGIAHGVTLGTCVVA